MLRFPTRASLAATVSAAALLAAAPLSAQQTSILYGGGGTLAAHTYSLVLDSPPLTPANTCGTLWGAGICTNYGYVGSGLGFAALAADNANAANNTCSSTAAWCTGGVATVANIEYYANVVTPNVPAAFDNIISYASSDSGLSAAQLAAWNGTNLPFAQSGITLHTAQLPLTGPIEQVPAIGTPITVAFHYNGAFNTNGGIKLTEAQVCALFNGSITASDSKYLTGGAGDNVNFPNAYNSANYPTGKTLKIVYRSDSSGTTFLFTQHLATVCHTLPAPANALTFTATQTFASLFTTVPSVFTGASGSAAVESAINSTTYSFGYLSPDYTKIAPRNAGGSFPVVALVQNRHTGSYEAPNYGRTNVALNSYFTANPVYPADPTINGVVSWSPPVSDPTAGYPIVGFTNLFFPQCFQNNDKYGWFAAFLTALLPGGGDESLINGGGFSVVPSTVANFINNNILSNGSNNTDIQNANVCQAAGASGPGTYAGR